MDASKRDPEFVPSSGAPRAGMKHIVSQLKAKSPEGHLRQLVREHVGRAMGAGHGLQHTSAAPAAAATDTAVGRGPAPSGVARPAAQAQHHQPQPDAHTVPDAGPGLAHVQRQQQQQQQQLQQEQGSTSAGGQAWSSLGADPFTMECDPTTPGTAADPAGSGSQAPSSPSTPPPAHHPLAAAPAMSSAVTPDATAGGSHQLRAMRDAEWEWDLESELEGLSQGQMEDAIRSRPRPFTFTVTPKHRERRHMRQPHTHPSQDSNASSTCVIRSPSTAQASNCQRPIRVECSSLEEALLHEVMLDELEQIEREEARELALMVEAFEAMPASYGEHCNIPPDHSSEKDNSPLQPDTRLSLGTDPTASSPPGPHTTWPTTATAPAGPSADSTRPHSEPRSGFRGEEAPLLCPVCHGCALVRLGGGYIACPREKWKLDVGFEGLGLAHLRRSLASAYQSVVWLLREGAAALPGERWAPDAHLAVRATQAPACQHPGGRKAGGGCV
ncbi:MAG: hypothetical protein WDW38_008141 [Sanguina aurantia]